MQRSDGEPTTFTVLVTGANSGLGFAICCRLIDEFLATRLHSQTLHVLHSTRDASKSEDTSRRLRVHLQKSIRQSNGSLTTSETRVKIEGVLVDLTKLRTVKALAEQLLDRGDVLDAVIWNAGLAGWKGTDYLAGTWAILTNIIQATTYPEFMIPSVGLLAAPQTPDDTKSNQRTGAKEEPKLGQIFLSNVFGHYLLTHWLAPLFRPSSRIIWTSSTSAVPPYFNIDDIQGINVHAAYESSKRLTDLLVLTSELPSTRSYVQKLLDSHESAQETAESSSTPKMILTHPGIVATPLAAQNWFMQFWMVAALYLARWLSSPWHPIDPYKGAISAVFAALSPPYQLPELEVQDGKGKWGSATGVYGEERVARTEVEGWGYCGVVGKIPAGSVTTGRWAGRKDVDKESREEFEEQGRRVWREMEELRLEWEAILS
ncbi:3-keto-steroid reductase [Elasticomyces elasticus]|nr:3-keto-steroid reductase [Elasticomyces elasticus]KAK3656673.1 3-keto-steroid reductase [Elasticomyces elasticus]KAK4921545.1 3-keto-steroid reductase [Elasticomyces elasticus]KAK5760233.1 3-keto-steroid reductase [Elasticomyces elasticus]